MWRRGSARPERLLNCRERDVGVRLSDLYRRVFADVAYLEFSCLSPDFVPIWSMTRPLGATPAVRFATPAELLTIVHSVHRLFPSLDAQQEQGMYSPERGTVADSPGIVAKRFAKGTGKAVSAGPKSDHMPPNGVAPKVFTWKHHSMGTQWTQDTKTGPSDSMLIQRSQPCREK
jgi:hypothetical protein